MKKLFTLLSILLISSTFAQQRLIAVKGTVTDTIANTLSQAIGLAQPGDKIYLPGGFYEHLPAINKQVHIIGTGFQDGQNVMGRTTINGSLTLSNLANSSTFEGLYLTEWFTQVAGASDDITIKRCNMKGTYPVFGCNYTNSQFVNCVVREYLHLGEVTGGTYGQNNYVQNCILTYGVYRTNSSSIENCLLTVVYDCTNSFVKKNIFYRNDGNFDSIYSSSEIILENNLFKLNNYPGYNLGSTISSELGSGVYNQLSDLFVNVPITPLFSFNASHDYHLKPPFTATPPNIGIYGVGSYIWKDGSLPIIPNIEQNSSYLDVQTTPGEFKLKVKVVPQTH